MSDIETQTPPQDPGATDGGATPPAATNPNGGGGATDDNTVTLNKEDYNNLISQRDRANNTNSETDAVVNELLKKDAINSFLTENKDKYPDVNFDDLTLADSPEELEKLAERQQKRIEDAVQKKLMDVQTTTAPVLSPQEKAQQLKQLKDNPDGKSFGKMLELNGK